MMKSLHCLENGTIELVDQPRPASTDGMALVAVEFCGLCTTDIDILEGRFWGSYPVTPGHEISGTIVDIADTSSGFEREQRVAVDPNILCKSCDQCVAGNPHLCTNLRAIGVTEPGGFAEYVRVPISNLYAVPEAVGLDKAALSEPLACVLHGIDRARVRESDAIAIYGAGFIGLLFALVLKHHGATNLAFIEPSPQRAAMAADLGFRVTSVPSETPTLSIDCSGNSEAIQSAIAGTRPGGRIVLFGVADPEIRISFSPYEAFRRELTILGSFINPNTQQRAVDLLPKLDLDSLITHKYRLEDFADAVEMKRTSPQALKILIKPG